MSLSQIASVRYCNLNTVPKATCPRSKGGKTVRSNPNREGTIITQFFRKPIIMYLTHDFNSPHYFSSGTLTADLS